MIISLTGFMGSGKTSSGKALAGILGASFDDLDELIVRREGRSIPDIFADGGEEMFRKAEYDALKSYIDEASSDAAPRVLALGGGAVTYAPSLSLVLSETRCVYLKASLEMIRSRVGAADASRPLFRDADNLYSRRKSLYEKAALSVDTDGKTPYEVAVEIAALL